MLKLLKLNNVPRYFKRSSAEVVQLHSWKYRTFQAASSLSIVPDSQRRQKRQVTSFTINTTYRLRNLTVRLLLKSSSPPRATATGKVATIAGPVSHVSYWTSSRLSCYRQTESEVPLPALRAVPSPDAQRRRWLYLSFPYRTIQVELGPLLSSNPFSCLFLSPFSPQQGKDWRVCISNKTTTVLILTPTCQILPVSFFLHLGVCCFLFGSFIWYLIA